MRATEIISTIIVNASKRSISLYWLSITSLAEETNAEWILHVLQPVLSL